MLTEVLRKIKTETQNSRDVAQIDFRTGYGAVVCCALKGCLSYTEGLSIAHGVAVCDIQLSGNQKGLSNPVC